MMIGMGTNSRNIFPNWKEGKVEQSEKMLTSYW